jgi:hypothetical protein
MRKTRWIDIRRQSLSAHDTRHSRLMIVYTSLRRKISAVASNPLVVFLEGYAVPLVDRVVGEFSGRAALFGILCGA